MIAKLWSYVIGLGAILTAILGFFFYAKRQGKKEEQNVETERALKQAKEASVIDTRVRNMSDSQLDEQLRTVRRPPPK